MALYRRTFLTASVASAAPGSAFSQTRSTADLRDDIALLRKALRLHPGLYRYNTPADVEARMAALEPAFAGAPDQAARYLLLSRFLATIRCGHTYANFFNQSRAVASGLFDRPHTPAVPVPLARPTHDRQRRPRAPQT